MRIVISVTRVLDRVKLQHAVTTAECVRTFMCVAIDTTVSCLSFNCWADVSGGKRLLFAARNKDARSEVVRKLLDYSSHSAFLHAAERVPRETCVVLPHAGAE